MGTNVEDKTKEETSTVDKEALEKSFDGALDDLRKSLNPEGGEKDTTPPEEGKKTQEELFKAEKGEDDTSSGEEEDESPPPKEAKKSLSEEIAEDDPEAEMAMDIAPYLKSMADRLGKRVDRRTATLPELQKAVKDLTGLVTILAKAVLAGGEMQKSIKGDLDKIGEINIPSMTRLRKSGDRFETEGGEKMTKPEIMMKAMDLQSSGKLSTRDVIILEGRLNGGGGIPEEMKHLFKKEVK
jgi:hypothetical protein